MSNIFDGLRDMAFDTTTNVMGKDASWTPSTGGPMQTARVHFENADASQKLGDIEYQPVQPTMEYRKPFFSGLKASVDANNDESVTIDGIIYYVRSVKAIKDGNTLVAILDTKP